MSPPDLDPMIAWVIRGALALIFAQAAWHKGRDLDAAAQIVADYRVSPVAWAHFHASATLLAEAAVSVGLVAFGFAAISGALPPSVGLVFPLAAIGLLSLYSIAIGVNLARGRRDIDCGCMGPAGASPRIGPWLLYRNGVLAIGAGALAVMPSTPREFYWLDGVTFVAGLAAFACVWVAIHTLAGSVQRFGSGGAA